MSKSYVNSNYYEIQERDDTNTVKTWVPWASYFSLNAALEDFKTVSGLRARKKFRLVEIEIKVIEP